MPLIRIDLYDTWSEDKLSELLNGLHRAVVTAFDVPEGDRYQIVHQHPASEMIIEDTGLGFTRSKNVVVISITTRPRKQEQKVLLYKLMKDHIESLGLSPEDIVINLVVNQDEDWSFGLGQAQFLTGDL